MSNPCSFLQVCNNLGQCHCNPGFAPPNCSEPGDGGSIHSNPALSNATGDNSSSSSTASSQATTAAPTGGGSSLSTGAIVGVALSSGVVAVTIVAIVIVVVVRRSSNAFSFAGVISRLRNVFHRARGIMPATAPAPSVGAAPDRQTYGYNNYGYHPRFPQPPQPKNI